MRAITVTQQGEPVASNVQVVDDWSDPEPTAGHVVVKTEASALNHLDLWVGKGVPGVELQYPRIGGADGAGVIEMVGPGVDESWIGRRVLLNAAIPQAEPITAGRRPALHDIRMIGEHVQGTHAAKFVAPVQNVLDIDKADPVKAAALGLTHLTAYRMLVKRAGLCPGMTVLITGIGGGVALALLNICRHLGCRTIVTSRHQWKIERAKELGADDGVLDEGEDWSKQVRSLTHKRGVDICADSVGKAIHKSCIRSLARGGVLVTCGCTSGPDATTDLARVFWNQLSIIGSTMGSMEEFHEATALFMTGRIDPVIDSVHTPDDAPAAYERLESGEQFGKIVFDWR